MNRPARWPYALAATTIAAAVVTVLALAATTLVTVAALVSVATVPAQAGQRSDPDLAVSPRGLPANRVSTVTVTGTGYLVPPHAPGVEVFGGVYLFFGWVDDPAAFGPSIRNSGNNDGTFGVSYAYPGNGGDANTRDDGSGTMRLVSFTDGGESGGATGFHMDDEGNWSTTLQIYGGTFTTTATNGQTRTFDCLDVQCGVFTIGAHGIASETNEQFAPIEFEAGTAPADDPPAGAPEEPAGPPGAGNPAGGPATTSPGAPTTAPPATDPAAAAPDLTGNAGGSGPLDTNPTSVRSTGGDATGPLVVAAALAAAALAGTALWWRRRRTGGPAEPQQPLPSTPTGGSDT